MQKTCGAKTRAGGECKAPARENGRCKLHGGMSTGAPVANDNATKHGIYGAYLTEEEIALTRAQELGRVDDELHLCRVRLRRVLRAEQDANGKPEIEEVVERGGSGKSYAPTERKMRVRDYYALADRLMGRIESLEKTRLVLLDAVKADTNEGAPDGFEVITYDDEAHA